MIDFTLFGFLDAKTVFLILHVFGVAVGAGGAFMSDGIFFLATKDRMISKTEFNFLTMAHKLVSAGLFLLILSGIALFLLNPAGYLGSPKFLAKMSIIVILGINALFFHFKHIPLFERNRGELLSMVPEFKNASLGIFISGAISVVSWSFALILGMIKVIPWNYTTIMGIYAAAIVIALPAALLVRKRFFAQQ